MKKKDFSSELQDWVDNDKSNTVNSLIERFGEKSFAVLLLLLLFPSALPLPTGGVTNVLEIIAMLIAAEMILGHKTIWIPQRWHDLKLGEFSKERIIGNLLKLIKWSERFTQERMAKLLNYSLALRFLGLAMLIFTLGAFLSPPFSGLDTLPSAAVVLIALSIIVEDYWLTILGLILGVVGIYIASNVWSELIERIF